MALLEIVYSYNLIYHLLYIVLKKDRDESRGPFGGGGWIRTTVGIASRFTVCPLWPLGNTPVFASVSVELVDGLEPPTC